LRVFVNPPYVNISGIICGDTFQGVPFIQGIKGIHLASGLRPMRIALLVAGIVIIQRFESAHR